MNSTETLRILNQLENAHLLRPVVEEEPAYIFRHTLTQESAYDSLLHAQRREIHRAVAQAYEQVYPERCTVEFAPILARHSAQAGDAARTLMYATYAGDAAARVYANAEAIEFYTQALAAGTDRASSPQLLHLFLARGRAHELAGEYASALVNYREMQSLALARGDRLLELESLIAQATAYAVGPEVSDLPQAQALSTLALTIARDLGDRKTQARIYWNMLLINRFGNEGPDKAFEYGEKSLAAARELGLTEQIALTLKDLFMGFLFTGKYDRARAALPEMITLWRQLDNLPMLAEALGIAGLALFWQGQVEQAARYAEEAYALQQSIGDPFWTRASGAVRFYFYRELGDLKRAVLLAEESIATLGDRGFKGQQSVMLAELAHTFDWLGDFARATEYARRALSLSDAAPTAPAYIHPIFSSAVLASVSLHQGNRAAAEEWLAPFPISAFDAFIQNQPLTAQQLALPIAYVELALAQDDPTRALSLAKNAAGLLQEIGLSIFIPTLLHLQARALKKLNRAEEAYALLIDARQRAESMQSRFRLLPILFTQLELDSETRGPGDAARADRVRRQASQVTDSIVAHLPAELLDSFLNLPEVRKIMNERQASAA